MPGFQRSRPNGRSSGSRVEVTPRGSYASGEVGAISAGSGNDGGGEGGARYLAAGLVPVLPVVPSGPFRAPEVLYPGPRGDGRKITRPGRDGNARYSGTERDYTARSRSWCRWGR
ncbi:hypothetical protein SSAG_01890 [Streptomyces sp. Mg1]|nr:hypothetical protein SSAG_01890 [Streptomyces sp. Mg1]